jgi:hypothetical protein
MVKSFSRNLLVFFFFLTSVYRLIAQTLPGDPDIHEFQGPMKFLSSELLPGRDTNRNIVIGAHYDHLGQCGDSIYFGADDNTSGTAGGKADLILIACRIAA